jgi:redox-sensitive bicupin YhaK (pirin superfamily)
MKVDFFAADSVGIADHGWLKAKHQFSFAQYHNPQRMHFGVCRVLNDDWVAPQNGFGMHPHQNMEIITIPFSGALTHKDNMGHTAEIKNGDVQVMSAGTGITHSEFNYSTAEPVTLFQIWLYPNKKNVTPRYQQISIAPESLKNNLQLIVTPNVSDNLLWIHQDAWLYLSNCDNGKSIQYTLKRNGNGVFIKVIEGSLKIDNRLINQRDAIGIWDTDTIAFECLEDNTRFLLMDLPMN